MSSTEQSRACFDLTPHPRILPMLGEIVLPQWRCLAELIDNSVDSFIEAARAGHPIRSPRVVVSTPMNPQGSQVSVRDNGPGMDWATLEGAARAGWTSHDPVSNLGLFGVGFNIATARLGLKTTIWTTRSGQPEWVGLQIDFDQLTRQQAFTTPALSRPKTDPEYSGTEVIVERLKPEQAEWFGKGSNRTSISRQLGTIYSSMIGPASTPVGFRLEVNGAQVRPKMHCIWGGPGNEERTVETATHGTVNAFQPVDVRLGPRPFCKQCWNWLGPEQTACPFCGTPDMVIRRERRVHGWLGVQRYLSRTDYGIDIIRNGRKIEIGAKDLFKWYEEDTGAEEIEYPIDDPRDRGRFVGEIHLDHCRVPYTKDRFVREDAAWREMVEIVRGTTPLRPDIALQKGRGENNSPLFRLFQAFRRPNPHNRRVGDWRKILVVPDNERAETMARRFDAGDRDYGTDQKWWELVLEAEGDALQGGGTAARPAETLGAEPAPGPGADLEGQPAPDTVEAAQPQGTAGQPSRTHLASLSQEYVDDLTGQRFEVRAFAVDARDPALLGLKCPWSIHRTTAGPWEFYVHVADRAFQSVTLTPLDALLSQLAWLACDFEQARRSGWTFGAILTSLRARYATSSLLEPQGLVSEAAAQLVDVARSIVGRVAPDDARTFFDGLSPSQQEGIRVTTASRRVTNPQAAIDDRRFLQYASPSIISGFVLSNPCVFFDGRYWDEPFETIDYGSPAATDEARRQLLDHYGGLLADVVWLAQQAPGDLEGMSRERLMRASLATALLAPTADVAARG